jgi:hypothetical protein
MSEDWKIVSRGKELSYPHLRLLAMMCLCIMIGMMIGHNIR